jgi:hypothetical protein
MNRYFDLIAYPVMYLAVYVLMGFINWNRDPETWSVASRVSWIIWATAWGMALQYRLNYDFKKAAQCSPQTSPSPST